MRVAATVKRFIDRCGLLDADHAQALARGEHRWTLLTDRTPAPWPGRYLAVVDSAAPSRPVWASPAAPHSPKP